VREERLPGATDIDEIVSVGAVAMQEYDQLFGRAA
jgi:hypothetical protein